MNSNFVSRYRLAIYNLLTARDSLAALKKEWDALGLSGSLDQAQDFVGENSEIIKADLASAVSSMASIESFIAAGFHDTNFYKVRKAMISTVTL